MPGIHYTGELTTWDGKLETNEFLYATSVAQEAILLGFGSLVEKKHNSVRFGTGDGVVEITLDTGVRGAPKAVTLKRLQAETVWMYTIPTTTRDGWYKNNNPFNNITTEWKTTHSIECYIAVPVEMGPWLKKNGYEIVFK